MDEDRIDGMANNIEQWAPLLGTHSALNSTIKAQITEDLIAAAEELRRLLLKTYK